VELFNIDYLPTFLGVLRKYMQMRGGLSQKDLAELTGIGESSLSRFMNQKSNQVDPQMVANLVIKLAIPLHEIIDFIREDATEKFKKLLSLYREDPYRPPEGTGDPDELTAALGSLGTKRNATATVKVGNRKTKIPFSPDLEGRRSEDVSLKDKMAQLSPRQKAYLAEFLNLDMEGRDLVVDLGNSLFRYFKHRGIDL
jgi:transcriptional regulator with XRE-family HTH domain